MGSVSNFFLSPTSSGQLLLGCLWGQHPIKKCEANSFCQKWQTEIPEGFACPIPPINGADFVGREWVISGHPVNRFGSGFGSNTKVLHEVIDPISVPNDYVNTVWWWWWSMMLSACAGAVEKMSSHGPHRKTVKLVAILSLCVKRFSLQARNMLFVGCPIK